MTRGNRRVETGREDKLIELKSRKERSSFLAATVVLATASSLARRLRRGDVRDVMAI
jgi:hypothetical protein